MRLNQKQLIAIKRNFNIFFGNGKIYLFGSRADDTKKGGDIDLYISTKNKENLSYKKIQFLVKLKRDIGEQKIDVVFDYGQNRLIDKKAKLEGIEL
jgi:predicted nucleotidyltransferase